MDPIKSVVATIRALIISRPQNTTLEDLMKEYRQMEGGSIPFKKFGYENLQDFLLSTKSFDIRNQNGQIFVRAHLKQESAHLVKMIAAQKKTKPKKKSSASAVAPSRGAAKPFQSQKSLVQSRFPTGMSTASYRPPQSATRYTSKPSRPVDFRPRSRPDLFIRDQMRAPTHVPQQPIISKPSVNQRIRSEMKEDLSNRLVSPHSNGFGYSPPVIPPGYKEPEVSISVTPEPEIFILSKDTPTPIEDLEKFCQSMNYADPLYTYSCVTFKGGEKMFQCRVTILSKTYCTYPIHCQSITDAQATGARIAIEQVLKEEEIKKYPMCREDDVTIAGKLLEILKDFKTGLVDTAIPEQFRDQYGLSLPENWLNLLYKYDEFSVEDIGSRRIVYSRIYDRPDSDLIKDIDVTEFEQLHLPWSEKEWTIQITNAVSTTEIYGRILGDQYSTRLDSLMIDIEMAMITETAPQIDHDQVQEGQIYLVANNTNWSRVKVETIDQENHRYHCFCIDSGEQEVYTELYQCSQEYLKLPNQVIRFSLAFLENFDGHPYVKPHLDEILALKQFVGKICSKREEFEINTGETVPIKVILLNPDSPKLEDNINQIILQKICNETPSPQLERSALSYVKITHVSDNGDVFCQVKDFGLNYIQRLVDTLVEDEAKHPLRKPMEKDDPSIRYLIRDSSGENYYRATPVAPVNSKHTHHKMYCFDFGFILDVHNDDIFQLEPLSQALNKFPALAIRCRLYGLQNLNEAVVSRIKGLLGEDSESIIKVMVSTTHIPQVNCYKRHQGGTIFCINESIKIEEELERQNDSKSTPRSSPNSPATDVQVRITPSNKMLSRTSSVQKIEDFELPAIESTFTLCIAFIMNPSNFISQPFDDKINVKFSDMMKKMQKFFSGNKEKLDQVQPGQAYAVFVEKSGQWYRAIVDVVINHHQIQITLCDFGEKSLTSINNIRTLPSDFYELPKQAIRCSLHGIKPTHGDWTTDDILRFRELTLNTEQKFYSIIKNVTTDEEGKILELVLIDKSSPKDVIINNLFLKENRAVHT